MTSRFRDDGAVAVIVAFFSVVAFGFAAIVVDLGYARSLKARAQDAADSAALAGAAALFESGPIPNFAGARTAAHSNANQVLGSTAGWDTCVDGSALPALALQCVSFDAATDPRQVRVRIPTTRVDSFFGGVFGYGGVNVSASAVASLGPVEFTPECAICVLGSGPHDLNNATVSATQADISFDGDVSLRGTSQVRAVRRTVFLEGRPVGPSSGFLDELIAGAGPTDNPLSSEPDPDDPADLLPPIPPALPPPPPRVDPCNADPRIGGSGVYDTVELAGTCVLEEGTYVITGALTAATGARISGEDVHIWLLGGGSIDFSRAAAVDLSAPDEFLVFAPTGTPALRIFGASNSFSGHVYAPGGSIIGGPSGECTINGLIVVAELDVGGQCLVSTAVTARTTAPTLPPVLIR